MTTHDIDIDLPPLPEWMNNYTIPSDDFEHDQDVMLSDRMHDYARAAVEADRKRRGETVRKTDWDNELSSWSDDDFIRIFYEHPDLTNRLRKMLAEHTITQWPSSSTGHEESENAR